MRPNYENDMAKAAKALSDPIRMKVLVMIKEGRQPDYQSPVCTFEPAAVCPADLQLKLEDVSPSKLSYHLKELKEAGYIKECREGKRHYYTLQPDKLKDFAESLGWLYE
ncbi:metalloregulator ArsR/SmtB family transcription factor [Paenibacillus sp. FSL M7-1455]|nr:metalloregulator ArsR/SmtB family transcription factor [Paenibacillus cookii]KHF29365.1 Helix-turn-helix domain protein [Paenibacillus sp. P1XP2]HWO53657.1 metalloregulator ArsR/SmtB family transcription factor [Paenibacillus cookii]